MPVRLVCFAAFLFAAFLFGVSLGPAPAAAEEERYAALCERAIVEGARRGGVPVEILHAIALTETGRNLGGRLRPSPWAINREGKGHWFRSREEALAFARESVAAGRPSFDVGCVQINYRWHGHAFPSIEAMLDPEWTATYAAQFLRTLYEERGSWSEAAGAYHSLTPQFANAYRARFDRLLADLRPIELDAPAVAALPAAATRAERRAAQRRAAAERAADAGPPPEPVMGSLAAGLAAPISHGRAGGLLRGGEAPLLIQGAPLLAEPRAGLF
jgi:hypothetical protein